MPERFSRRDALRLIGTASTAGLAGCLSGTGSSPTNESPSDGSRPDLTFSATVDQSFTADHPGRVTIALTNKEDEKVVMGTAHGIHGPFSAIRGERESGGAKLVIFADPPSDEHETPPGAPCREGQYVIPEQRTDGCWEPACEFAVMHAHSSIVMEAGETLSWPYVVLDGFNDTCLPAGTYGFATTSPLAVAPPTPTMGPTPPGGWSDTVVKRVALDLAADGTLSASASLGRPDVD